MIRRLLAVAMLATMGLGVQVGSASAVGSALHECRTNAHADYRARVNNGQKRSVARKRLNNELQQCKRRFG